jgi:hypothetical protein
MAFQNYSGMRSQLSFQVILSFHDNPNSFPQVCENAIYRLFAFPGDLGAAMSACGWIGQYRISDGHPHLRIPASVGQ